jgi:hypothetical protein
MVSPGKKKRKKITAIVFFSLLYFLHNLLRDYPSKGSDCLALNIKGRRYSPLASSPKKSLIRQI